MSAWRAKRLDDRVELVGELRSGDAAALWKTLRVLSCPPGQQLDLDISGVAAIDGRTMALLVAVRERLLKSGALCEVVAPVHLRPLVHLFGGDRPVFLDPRPLPHAMWLVGIGAAIDRSLHRARTPMTFLGELLEACWRVLKRPKRANWRSLPCLIERAGADALVIVVLLDFLVGFVIALQSMAQLESFGANPFVANLVGISVCRELAPLMTAFILAGRSGAAYAAEIGTMHVTEEIDALETMGIAPIPYLVIPRIVALALIAPLLVLIGDVAGSLGGLVIGVTSLELTVETYISQLTSALTPWDVWTGIIKTFVFAIAIATIGCQEGLAARGAAAGVGRRTTATVVASIIAIVVIDSLLTWLFRAVGV
jgi:phospholipid/cholesterol/gamma-HCH transport system permease protein